MKTSAGLLLYRRRGGAIEFFLVHPGGPYWAGRDEGAWSIPKGEYTDEDPLVAARREFREETGSDPPAGPLLELTPVTQRGGKIVHAWAVPGDLDADRIHSNTFTLEWPPGSGHRQEFQEVDRAAWFETGEALRRILPSQAGLIREALALASRHAG